VKVALIQISASQDKAENIRKALGLTEKAIGAGAQLVVLPEAFNCRPDPRDQKNFKESLEKIPGPSLLPFLQMAQRYRVAILAGSIYEQSTSGKAYNTSVFIDPQGNIAGKYRKINLFNARLGDNIIKEADHFISGKNTVVVPFKEFKIGLSICYDLRFPSLYTRYALSGVNVLTVPSCFTKKTGQAHWEVLLRSRAIDAFSYVLAPNQTGKNSQGVETYGNSMIVSPWGKVIARGSGEDEEIVYGNIDIKEVKEARSVLPGVLK
jgi:deaminated glutathione amidase